MEDLFRGKRVFITGHTGFKGSWLALWLKMLGAEVTGYSLPPAYPDSHFELLGIEKEITHYDADIRDYANLHQAISDAEPDFVFHLAAQALVRSAYRDPKETFDVNIGGSVNVLECLRKLDFQGVLVYITSDKCYRNQEWAWGYREIDALGGKDPYSASKGAAELVFEAYAQSYFQGDCPRIASARAGNVIGGGDWAEERLVPDCIRALQTNEPIVLRNPTATRPWQHVLEPVGAYLHLASLLASENGKAYQGNWNVGPDKQANKSVEELVQEIVGYWGSGEYRVEKDPHALREDHFLHLNCDKAHQLLRWKPIWGFHEGVKHTVDWYRAFVEGNAMRTISEQQIDLYSTNKVSPLNL